MRSLLAAFMLFVSLYGIEARERLEIRTEVHSPTISKGFGLTGADISGAIARALQSSPPYDSWTLTPVQKPGAQPQLVVLVLEDAKSFSFECSISPAPPESTSVPSWPKVWPDAGSKLRTASKDTAAAIIARAAITLILEPRSHDIHVGALRHLPIAKLPPQWLKARSIVLPLAHDEYFSLSTRKPVFRLKYALPASNEIVELVALGTGGVHKYETKCCRLAQALMAKHDTHGNFAGERKKYEVFAGKIRNLAPTIYLEPYVDGGSR